jgi:alpha-methylacyl-CoA racemase
MAEHDINYISMTRSQCDRRTDRPPPPPLNMVGDFGEGSMFLSTGILAALLERPTTGKGTIGGCCYCRWHHNLMSLFTAWLKGGQWRPAREQICWTVQLLLRCYKTSDGKFIWRLYRPQFFAAMIERLPIEQRLMAISLPVINGRAAQDA